MMLFLFVSYAQTNYRNKINHVLPYTLNYIEKNNKILILLQSDLIHLTANLSETGSKYNL
jgi:hypothetical protein